MRVAQILLLVALLGSGVGVRAAPEPGVSRIVLRSGKVLEGRVVGGETVGAARYERVEGDFGVVLVPRREIAREEHERAAADGTYQPAQVWVAAYEGRVERLPQGSTEWQRIDWTRSPYGPVINAPGALVRPGDRVRTGEQSWIELLLHRDVWVRVTPESEVEIPAAATSPSPAASTSASLTLIAGATVQHVTARPRGQVFRLATPSGVLGVRGTWFAAVAGSDPEVVVHEGEVVVEGRGSVGKGQFASLSGSGPLTAKPLEGSDAAWFETEPFHPPARLRVYVPGGTYVLGDEDGPSPHPAFSAVYRTRVSAKLDDYLIDADEVTREEYQAFRARFQGATLPPVDVEYLAIVEPAEAHASPEARKQAQVARWRPQEPAAGPSRAPVHGIDWHAAAAYARWSGADLPTEAQWEVAARGPKGRLLPWGDELGAAHVAELALTGWDRGTSGAGLVHRPFTLPAPERSIDDATLDVSPFGARGLVTRVPEFVRDWWTLSPFAQAVAGSGGDVDRSKVGRGYLGSPRARRMIKPDELASRGDGPGFRCVYEIR